MTTSYRLALPLLAACCALGACNKSSQDGSTSAAPPASAAPAVEGTTFTIKAPTKGTTRTANEKTNMQFTIAVLAGGKVAAKMDMKQDEEHDTQSEVLAANDKAPTKVKVSYLKRVQIETNPKGKTKTDKSPVDGKTYIAEFKGGEIVVTTPDGKPVKAKEAKVVKKDNKELGKQDPFSKMLPNHPLKKGEKLEITKDLVAQLFGDDDMKMDIDNVSMTFQGTKQEGGRTEGLFDMKLQVTGYPEPTLGLQMKIDGTVALDTATGWPISMHLKGPIEVKGEDPKRHLHMEGQGKMEMQADYSYK